MIRADRLTQPTPQATLLPPPNIAERLGHPQSLTPRDKQRFLFAALIILAVGLSRFLGLDHLLMWHDEVFTLIRIFGYSQGIAEKAVFSGQLLAPADLLRFQLPSPLQGWGETLQALKEHPEHAPLYYLIARLATELPVDPVTAVRSVSATFSLLLIPASFWLMRELFGRGLAPWVAAALIAFSPLELLFAQEARQYSLWLLLTTVSSLVFLRSLRGEGLRHWALYGLTITLGLYSHLLFVAILPVHASYGLLDWLERSGRRQTLFRAAVPWVAATGGAALLFTPWIWIIVSQSERVASFTGWMHRPMGPLAELLAWAGHLTRTFVDLSPTPSSGWMILLVPLAWALARFIRKAPRPACWLLPLLALAYIAVVLGPDALHGGSRSQHVRYTLPAMLAVQLMVAWVIADALEAKASRRVRQLATAGLALVLSLGAASQIAIHRADTWSTKNFSASDAAVARIVNASDQGLVLASASGGIGLGELIALSYHLKPNTQIIGQSDAGYLARPTATGPAVVLGPTDAILSALGPSWQLATISGSWQWFRAVPKAAK